MLLWTSAQELLSVSVFIFFILSTLPWSSERWLKDSKRDMLVEILIYETLDGREIL